MERSATRARARGAFTAWALLMQVISATAADHTSKLKFAACSVDEPLQRFSMDIGGPGKSGEIRDHATGRCVAVRDCSVDLQFSPGGVPQAGTKFGEAVLDECGSECAGKASQWKENSGSGSGLVFVTEADTSACFALNAVGAVDGTHNTMVAVWGFGTTCTDFSGGALNSEFNYDEEHGHLKLLNTDRAEALHCPAANCCLQAEPCVDPCTLPAGAGWTFVVLFVSCCVIYIAGGVTHSVKVRGVPPSAGAGQLLPHTEHWVALVGLVHDGVAFTKARYAAYRGQPAPGDEALMSAQARTGTAENAAPPETDPPGSVSAGAS